MPAAQPRTWHTTGTCTVHSSGISRCACDGSRRWMLPTARLAPPSPAALRATMSAPPQKWSPAPSSTIDPHALVACRRASTRVDEAAHHRRRRSRCACRAGRACSAQHAAVERRRRDRRPTRSVAHRRANSSAMASSAPLQVGRAAGRIGQPHRPVLAARQQDRGVPGRGDLAALVRRPRARGRPRAGRRRRGTCATTVPRSHCVSPT